MLYNKLGKDINGIIDKYLYFKPKLFIKELLYNTKSIKRYLNQVPIHKYNSNLWGIEIWVINKNWFVHGYHTVNGIDYIIHSLNGIKNY